MCQFLPQIPRSLITKKQRNQKSICHPWPMLSTLWAWIQPCTASHTHPVTPNCRSEHPFTWTKAKVKSTNTQPAHIPRIDTGGTPWYYQTFLYVQSTLQKCQHHIFQRGLPAVEGHSPNTDYKWIQCQCSPRNQHSMGQNFNPSDTTNIPMVKWIGQDSYHSSSKISQPHTKKEGHCKPWLAVGYHEY